MERQRRIIDVSGHRKTSSENQVETYEDFILHVSDVYRSFSAKVKSFSDDFKSFDVHYSEEIDKGNLDKECCQVPANFDYWGNKEVEAQNLMDAVKTHYDLVRVKTELRVKGMSKEKLMELFEVNMTTVDTYKALVEVDKIVIKWNFLLQSITQIYKQISIKKRSLEMRAKMIDTLAKLFASEYFVRDYKQSETREIRTKFIREKIAETMNRSDNPLLKP